MEAQGGEVSLTGAIGVVDYDRIYRAYGESTTREAALKREKDAIDAEFTAAARKIRDLETDAGGFDPFTPAWWKAKQDIETQKKSLEIRAKLESQRLIREDEKLHEDVFKAIDAAVAKFAAGAKLQLVLRHRTVPDQGLRSRRLGIHEQREVIWYAKPLDVTDQVIKLMK